MENLINKIQEDTTAQKLLEIYFKAKENKIEKLVETIDNDPSDYGLSRQYTGNTDVGCSDYEVDEDDLCKKAEEIYDEKVNEKLSENCDGFLQDYLMDF